MAIQKWEPVLAGEHIPIASMRQSERGKYVTATDHAAIVERLVGALEDLLVHVTNGDDPTIDVGCPECDATRAVLAEVRK